MKRVLHPILVLIIVLNSTPLFGDLVVNGSFEAPNVPTFVFVSYNAGSTLIPGWAVVGAEITIEDHFFTSGITFQAQDGDQQADLTGQGSNNPNTGLIQNVATTVGAEYRLSFHVGSATEGTFYFASTVDLSIDGGSRSSFTNPTAPLNMGVNWLQFTVPFTAQNSITTIAFFNGSAANNFGCGLDNVTLIQFLLGDVNGDGMTNLLDVAPFVNVLTSGSYVENADMNQDGEVNLLDVALFVDALSS